MIKEKRLGLDEDIKFFADELKKCFSRDEIEEIARETGFVKRNGKIKSYEFVCLCCFMDVEVASNTRIPSVWDEYFKRIRILDSTAFQVPENYKNIYPG